MSETRSRVAEEVRALCARRKLTQKALGEVLGYSQPTISDRYNGVTAYTLDDLDRIAAYFDVPITDLFGTRSEQGKRPTACYVDSAGLELALVG